MNQGLRYVQLGGKRRYSTSLCVGARVAAPRFTGPAARAAQRKAQPGGRAPPALPRPPASARRPRRARAAAAAGARRKTEGGGAQRRAWGDERAGKPPSLVVKGGRVLQHGSARLWQGVASARWCWDDEWRKRAAAEARLLTKRVAPPAVRVISVRPSRPRSPRMRARLWCARDASKFGLEAPLARVPANVERRKASQGCARGGTGWSPKHQLG
ncbi:MAG: hypothetical protein J3K34DRAFT_250039 [Monoraphidium minutum]|nr:MAG: hypothetical protein J3K34DRAFT_250039 [Monoraphidium minutum]